MRDVNNRLMIVIFLGVVIIVSGCTSEQEVDPETEKFAQCLKESGVKMYGSFTCSVCKRQIELFGSAFESVGEIECHPRGENPQTELCLEKDISKTPTWTLEKDGVELERLEGFQSFEKLSELSGCKL
ncbi:MAG: hypothetical protein QGF74_01255 [Candidatus Nanoarchaeia archaeon]|jgi:hypothetical protein|nr:hypothetical protein [Candidatus Nanoarchaeia archaeon]|tara:strand:- start:13283 stop:13666 length:384 start_codon:yes stop_codon:yes gene_type:complete